MWNSLQMKTAKELEIKPNGKRGGKQKAKPMGANAKEEKKEGRGLGQPKDVSCAEHLITCLNAPRKKERVPGRCVMRVARGSLIGQKEKERKTK